MTRRSFSLYGYKTIIGLPVVLGAVLWILTGFFIRAQPVQLSIGVGDASFFDGFHGFDFLEISKFLDTDMTGRTFAESHFFNQ